MTEVLDRLQSAPSDRYTIERELGRGGTATVYPAAALLRPELAASLGSQRFLREIEIAPITLRTLAAHLACPQMPIVYCLTCHGPYVQPFPFNSVL